MFLHDISYTKEDGIYADYMGWFTYYKFIYGSLPSYTDIFIYKKEALLGLRYPGPMDGLRSMDDYKQL